ncbi:SpoIID/LytB domain-containing protein [Megasphaera sp. AM44-1BH]|uniref:SpoIID/LytB domain-containing protein n=1 Tax=Megasphaera sp. AM44-1BH TaxID=2292358 RepID=UPI000E488616|nr:SpoIID/LytB domain-containing protein [Megasphaera sp. AM44-1BH]RHA12141.1 SpoIID/LytB domain-containing protein [Megasphaera sp. AM44-1BH]
MWIKKIVYLVIAAFCLFSFGGTAAASGMGQTVRIGIREGRGSVALTSDSGLGVWKNGSLWKKFPARTPLQIALKGNAVTVGGAAAAGAVEVRPLSSAGSVKITDGYAYRGAIRVMKSPQRWGLTVVNVVPVEEYLYGVVGKEMSPSWHREALKAQAVAARTYAISHKNYFASRGFDMTDDTSSQIYAGINGESPSVIAAVDATRGEILTYGGKPIDAFFCSTAGGWTENSENVWGSRIPYLRGVSDDSSRMPSYRWSVTTTPEKLAANLTAAGKGVGKVRSITLSPLGKRPMAVSDRGVSGRVLSMTVNGSAGSVRVTGNAFQSIYGLKSTLFDFSQGGAVPDPDSGCKGRSATMTVKAGVPITIYGYGWGHGLGMSQYGAYQMAQEHGSADTYYRTILTHYYTGTRLEKLY